MERISVYGVARLRAAVAYLRSAWRYLLLALLVCVLATFGWQRLSSTERELVTLRAEISDLRRATTETFATQGVLLAEQAEHLTRQEEVLEASKEQDVELEKRLAEVRDVQAAAEANPQGISSETLGAIAQSVVKIACNVDAGGENEQRGSGMLRVDSQDPNGPYYVQTSLHVVETEDGAPSRCTITVFPDYRDPASALTFASEGYRTYREGVDLAYLTPLVVNGEKAGTVSDLAQYARSVATSPVCAATDSGDHVTILGYPAIGGDTLTITDGIISGVEFDGEVRYLKTSAKIDSGNSGGVAVKDAGCLVGIPTSVRKGRIESIGRILDLNHLFSS